MRRQTVFRIILGGLLALIATRVVRPRNRNLIRQAVPIVREIRQNVFLGRLFSGAMVRRLLRRFQWAR